MKKLIFISCLLLTANVISFAQQNFPKLTGPYFGQKPPGITPELFAPGVVSTGMTEGSMTFTSDGKACYWTLHPSGFETIVMSKIENGRWTRPEVAPYSGKYLDGFPSMHPDGSKLYFHSFRPTGDKVNFPARLNIWVVNKVGDGWSKPKLVEAPVNGKGNSGCPCVTENGTLYFSRVMPSGAELMVRSRYVDGRFSKLEVLPGQVNTTTANFHGFVAPDESYLIIPRTGRDDLIDTDWEFYISFRNENDEWSELKNLGFLINNAGFPLTPSVSTDGKYFFFQAIAPEVYHDGFEKRMSLAEFQEREIQYPVNRGKDVYWISTYYFNIVKSLDYTNILYAMKETIKKKDIHAAIALYRDLKEKHPEFYDFSEPMLNRLGYELLGDGESENAIEVFKLNVEVYPDSWNVYDSLGEAYMENGQNNLAISSYEKSIALNPKNAHGIEIVKRLKNQ